MCLEAAMLHKTKQKSLQKQLLAVYRWDSRVELGVCPRRA
jgi:hypothetical protein